MNEQERSLDLQLGDALAEIERLKAERDALLAENEKLSDLWSLIKAERDALKAEADKLARSCKLLRDAAQVGLDEQEKPWVGLTDDEFGDEITHSSLLGTIYAMDGYLDDYEDPDHGFIAVFSADEKEDISKIREMRNALALVAGWYGKAVEPLKPIERSEDITGTCAVELIRENADGSADFALDFTDEQVRAFTRLGIMTAIKAGLEEAKKLDPVSKGETIVFKVETEGDNILALAEEAGFCMWGNESHKPEGATIDWSCNYDEELVKFYRLARIQFLSKHSH